MSVMTQVKIADYVKMKKRLGRVVFDAYRDLDIESPQRAFLVLASKDKKYPNHLEPTHSSLGDACEQLIMMSALICNIGGARSF